MARSGGDLVGKEASRAKQWRRRGKVVARADDDEEGDKLLSAKMGR